MKQGTSQRILFSVSCFTHFFFYNIFWNWFRSVARLNCLELFFHEFWISSIFGESTCDSTKLNFHSERIRRGRISKLFMSLVFALETHNYIMVAPIQCLSYWWKSRSDSSGWIPTVTKGTESQPRSKMLFYYCKLLELALF